MGILEYFIYAFPVVMLELIAALAGTFYIRKVPAASIWIKRFVYFLWFTFLIEALASYAVIGHFSSYKYFAFVKDTNFEKKPLVIQSI